MPNQKICRLPDVVARTGLSRSTIYELISRDEFPPQISLGRRSVGWLESEIQDWINDRIKVSRQRDHEVTHGALSKLPPS